MTTSPAPEWASQAAILPDGRLHLNEGPIDLIIGAFGDDGAVETAYARATARFHGLLPGLCAELPGLRAEHPPAFTHPVAQAMAAAVAPYRPDFITPMAAVAGAVADHVLPTLAGAGITRAYVNNGGDIALHLTAGESLAAALAGTETRVRIGYESPIRGIATSGWHGRSFSFGIADAVTALAPSAAMADAAATMIANAVDLPDHPGILRRAARDLQHDTDLGARAVTVVVPLLSPDERAKALAAGIAYAERLVARGLIAGAALFLQSEMRVAGILPLTKETTLA